MLLAVAEDEVDDGTDDGKEEDDNCPEELMRDGAAGLEELNCRGCQYLAMISRAVVCSGYPPQMMISITNTMKPMIPPPVPYCHASVLVAWSSSLFSSGAAKVRAARQSWRKALKNAMLKEAVGSTVCLL